MSDLILFALKDEAPDIFQEYNNVFEIGVGKVNAALNTVRLILEHKPKRIINLGTAGGIRASSGIHKIKKVIQHDVNLIPLGLKPGFHLCDNDSEITLAETGMICASGDLFVTEPNKLRIDCDIVEMEAYSVARAGLMTGIEVEIWKYISDKADDEAPDAWKQKVNHGEKLYRDVLSSLGVNPK